MLLYQSLGQRGAQNVQSINCVIIWDVYTGCSFLYVG